MWATDTARVPVRPAFYYLIAIWYWYSRTILVSAPSIASRSQSEARWAFNDTVRALTAKPLATPEPSLR